MLVAPEALPSLVGQVRDFFRDQGIPVWLVGGTVRDALLGRPTHDVDLVVEADGLRWARRLADALGGAFVPLDVEHDTGRVVLLGGAKESYVDVASFRAPTLEEDLWARDFTVNALAADMHTGRVVDPTGGLADLNRFRLRMSRPDTFRQDPARLMRGVRLAVTLGFVLEEATRRQMSVDAPLVADVAPERVTLELIKMLESDCAPLAVALMDDVGLLAHVLPEVAACQGVAQPAPHTMDVYGHILETLAKLERLWPWAAAGPGDHLARKAWGRPLGRFRQPMAHYLETSVSARLSRRTLLKLAALFHDVGKPATRAEEGGRVRFRGHEEVGARLTAQRLEALRLPTKAVRWVEHNVRHHMRPFHLSQAARGPGRRALYRYFRDTGDAAPAIALLSLADHLAKGGTHDMSPLRRVLHAVWRPYFQPDRTLVNPSPLLDGHTLQRMGVPPGPELGRLLERLKEAQAAGVVRTPEEAERYVRRLWRERARSSMEPSGR